MINHVNIPLRVDPTRQALWRVVRLGVTVLLVLGSGWTIARGILTYDRTPSELLNEADYSLRLLKNSDTHYLVTHQLSGLPLIARGPWSLADGLNWSSRGLTLIQQGETSIVVIDNELDPAFLNTAERYELFTLQSNGHTIVSTAPISHFENLSPSFPRVSLAALRRQTDALIGEKGRFARIDSKPTSLTLYGGAIFSATRDNITSLDPTTIIATLSMNTTLIEAVSAFTPAANTPGAQTLAHLLTSEGASITVYTDDRGIGYSFLLPLSSDREITNNDLITLGKEIVSIPDLTQDQFFLPDGTVVQELRTQAASVTVVDEHPYAFVTVELNGRKVTLSRTESVLRLTNRPIEPATPEQVNRRAAPCMRAADAWIQPQKLLSGEADHVAHRPVNLTALLLRAEEIASSTRTSRVCW